MRICIITPHFPTKEGVGGYFFVEQLVNQFAKQGHQCIVIATANIATKYFIHRPYGQAHELRKIEGGNDIEIFRPRYYGRNITFLGVSLGTWAEQYAIECLIKKSKLVIDAFYCHFFSSGVIAWHYASKKGIPLFIASGESTIKKLDKPCRSFSIEKFKNYISGVICVSTKNKEEAVGLGYTIETKCIVIPNGVDLNLFVPINKSLCRKELAIDSAEFVVICVGNIVERKGQNRLLEAVEKLNREKHLNIKLILAGRGEIKKSTSLLYCGFVPHEKLPVYFNASDIYVIPTRWEGCCNSIVEAMACGMPIVSSDRSFNWDILNKDNAILIDPDNINEIANAIESLYNNSDLLKRMGVNSLKTSQNLSIEKRAEKILAFMQLALSK